MKTITIIVADAARARVFTYQPFQVPGNGAPRLMERADLVDPARRLRPSELVSDHRERHLDDLDRTFVKEIMAQAQAVLAVTESTRLVVVASPHMLGLLREHTEPMRARGLDIEEAALDLTRETAPQLQQHLVDAGLLPALNPRVIGST